jgi:hypothetical protein
MLIRIVPVLGLVAAGVVLAPAAPALASTTLTVNTAADSNPASGPCANGSTTAPSTLSLRDAICVANNLGGTVTIDVPAGTYDLSYGELDVGITSGQNITIDGAGAASTIIDAQGQSRVLNFDENLVGGIAGTVQDVTITGGSDSTFGGAGIIGGSGNATELDTLAIEDSVITGNHANNATPTATDNPGGGVQFIGGELTITDSTFSDNSSQSSPGAAIFYQAEGEGSPESFSLSGSSVTGNAGVNSTGSTVPTDGAVDLGAAKNSISMSVTDTTFTGNTLTATSGPVRGAALAVEGGTATVTDSDFSGNSISGSSGGGGGALAVVDGTLTATDDRIVGNQVASPAVGEGIYNAEGTVTATDDWWGCNAGPGSTGCDSVSGTVTTSPRVELTGPAVTVAYNSTAQVTANLEDNSAGAALGTAENDLDGVAETFADVGPSGAQCGPDSVTFSGGTASASCTFNPEGTDGAGDVTVTVDNQSVTVPVTITEPPMVTTSPSDLSVSPGQTATFTAAATGYPAPTVQWQVSSDGGSSYSNVSGATSTTLSFTATSGDNGNLYRAVFTNGTGTATTTPATLSEQQAPSFTSADSATFTVGTSGTFAVTTSGYPNAALTESGSLPSGVTFTDNGDGTATLAGTAVAGTGGSYPITITANNGVTPNATQSFTLTVDEAPSITSGDAATFAVGSAGTFTVTTGGYPNAALSESGALPGGVTFTDNGDGTATLAGTPAGGSSGSYPITITASNGISPDATQSFTLTVGQAPSITSGDAATFTAGSAGSFTVTTTGSGPPALTESGALPLGVTFTDNGDGTATLAGTPAAGTGGSYPITITAGNGVGPDATQSFTLTVNEAPSITSGSATTFTAGSSGTSTVTTGGYPAAALTESGALPSGVTFTDNGDGTATLAGTPAAGTGGSYPITIAADNGVGSPAMQSFTLTVDEAPSITSGDSVTFAAGSAGTFTVTTGGYPKASLSETGTLPSGVTFTDNGDGTATLAGTPAAGTGGSYPITITAGNGVGPDATQSFTLTVNESPSITSGSATTFTAGSSGTFTVTTGGYPAAALSETGTLPSGVTFTDNGDGTATLAGTPAAGTGGSYPITITASNGISSAATQSFTLTVDEAPSITSADSVTFAAGSAGTFTVTTDGYPNASLSETGTLPSGVTFTDNGDGTATLAGTPAAGTAAGSYPISITATNSVTSATQQFTLTVTPASQTIMFTSSPPTAPVVGQTYPVTATGGGSGNPVTFTIDSSSSSVCMISGSTVTFTSPGSCLIDASQAGDSQYSPATASQSVPVSKASTMTAVTVRPQTITATVTAVPPGAGTPTGSVAFSVDGNPVGTATLSGGIATLDYKVPANGTHEVSAVYGGDSDFTGSSGSTSRHNPSITAKVSSRFPETKYGWYRSAVTITFTCTTEGAPLTAPCPKPVTLTKNGAGQSVTESITATDGGTASVTVSNINIDTIPPTVSVSGVTNGATYFGAAPPKQCVARDALSGVAYCTLSYSSEGDEVTVTATAGDRAGNVSTVKVSYFVLHFYVLCAPYKNGVFQLREGHTYTFVALTLTDKPLPRLYGPVPAGQKLWPPGQWFRRAGRQDGRYRFTLAVTIGDGLGGHTYWDFGIQVESTMHLIEFHPVS